MCVHTYVRVFDILLTHGEGREGGWEKDRRKRKIKKGRERMNRGRNCI